MQVTTVGVASVTCYCIQTTVSFTFALRPSLIPLPAADGVHNFYRMLKNAPWLPHLPESLIMAVGPDVAHSLARSYRDARTLADSLHVWDDFLRTSRQHRATVHRVIDDWDAALQTIWAARVIAEDEENGNFAD